MRRGGPLTNVKHLRTSVFRSSHLMLSKGCVCWGRWEFREFRGHFTGYRMISSQGAQQLVLIQIVGKSSQLSLHALLSTNTSMKTVPSSQQRVSTPYQIAASTSGYVTVDCDLCNIVSVTINALKSVTCKNYFRHNIGLYNVHKCNLW